MLDSSRLEKAGVPTVVVITDIFVREAAYQADTSGMRGFKPIVVPHPTSHLPEGQIKALASSIVDGVLGVLMGKA